MRTHYCQNCGSPLRGAFCHSCGQKDDDYRRPLLSLTNEFLGDVFQWDSRVFRSIIPFLLIPGNLTRAYMRGRRQQYVSPLRLYLVISIAFFLALAASDRAIVGFTLSDPRNLLEDFPELSERLEEIDPEHLDWGQYIEVGMFVDPDGRAELPRIPVEDVVEFFGDSGFADRLIPLFLGYNAAIEDPRIFNQVLNDWVPRLMVILVPFFALILSALYVRRRVWFVDHLVFSLHFHSFMFAVLLLMLALSSWFGVTLKGLGAAFMFVAMMGVYLFIAMWRTYRGSLFKAVIKFMILGSVYINVFIVSLFFITAVGLSQLR